MCRISQVLNLSRTLSGEYEAFLSIPVLSHNTDNRTQVGLALTFFGWIVAQQQVSTVVLGKLHESGHLKQTSYILTARA